MSDPVSSRPDLPGFAISPADAQRRWLDQIAAIACVMLVIVGMYWGGDVALHFMRTDFNTVFGGILMELCYPHGSDTAPDPDFTQASWVNAEFFAYQYGGVVVVLVLLGLVGRRLRVRDLGITTGQRNLGQLIVIGVTAGAVANIASTVIFAGKELFPLGDDTPFWWAMDRVEWDLDMWIFMAVGSYVLVPLLEEFAYRGGMLGFMARAFAPGAALLGVGILFAAMHSQYWSLGPIGMITLVGVIYAGVIFGYVFLRTGSLVPAIIAHAMINVPVALEYEWLRVGLTVAVILIARRQIWEAGRRIASSLWSVDTLRLGLLAAMTYAGYWALTMHWQVDRKIIEICVLVAALGLVFLAGRRKVSDPALQ